MSVLVGLLTALCAYLVTQGIASRSLANVPAGLSHPLSLELVTVSCVVGFLAGAALCRRVRRSRQDLALFGALAFGVAGGLLGGALAVAVTTAYMRSYGTWPPDVGSQILVVLSYPALGALGFAVGAAISALFGVVASGALRLLVPVAR